MAELELKQVTFTFADGSQKVLKGEELEQWEVICAMHSDYLLPGAPNHILAQMLDGIIQGFVPPEAIKKS